MFENRFLLFLSTGSCPRVFDGWSCVPETSIGMNATFACPDFENLNYHSSSKWNTPKMIKFASKSSCILTDLTKYSKILEVRNKGTFKDWVNLSTSEAFEVCVMLWTVTSSFHKSHFFHSNLMTMTFMSMHHLTSRSSNSPHLSLTQRNFWYPWNVTFSLQPFF